MNVAASSTPLLDAALQQAAAHHQAGQLQEAEQLYRAILQVQTDHPDANHNLGLLLGQTGQPAAGLPYLKTALEADPAQGQYWLSYAEALLASGQAGEALMVVQTAMQHGLDTPAAQSLRDKAGAAARDGQATEAPEKPDQAAQPQAILASASVSVSGALPQAESGQLIALFNAGRHAEAESRARLACEQYPDSGVAWVLLGASLQMQGKDGLSALQKATALLPFDAMAHYNLGNALKGHNQLDAAVASYGRALEIKPDYAMAHNNLGVALQDLGRFDDAVASYARALEIEPDYAEAHSNLGSTLKELGQFDAAVASCRRALEIKPDFAEAYSNLGLALQGLGQLDDAVENYAQALEIKPDFAEAQNNLSLVLQDLGQFDGAVASCRRELEIKPDYSGAYDKLLSILNYHPDTSGEEVFAVYREYDQRFGLPHRVKWRAHGNSRDANRRLKVGYVSPDFRRHSCRHFLEPLLAHHDKTQVEVYAYAELAREDGVTARYRGYADHWVATAGMSDEALSERIRSDGIDILVDLAGHTDKNRLSVFARKPAPVSLSWLGFGYTTGLTAIDYLLTDAASAPPGSEGLFSETPWRLATPGYAYRPAEGMGEVSPLPALARGHITFGTLTRSVRINPLSIRVWSEILKRVEGSRLVIDSANYRDATMQDALAEKFAAHGIARDRLEIGYHSPPWEVLRGLDIGLDCFPHNSGTTLFETLYMGVPFVTLAGRPSVGRLGSSILEGAGHPEWIARSEGDYVEKAVALASNLPQLAALRGGLRHEMESGPLMDEAGFVRKVEAAYREMWGKWRGEKTVDRIQALPEAERNQLIALFNAGRHAEMESRARLACERYPDSGFAWKGLGVSLQMQGKDALAALQMATKLLPDDADAHNSLGVVLEERGQFVGAVASCRRALEIKPGLAEAHSNLGNALRGLGQLDEAAASYARALEIKPGYAEAHNNLGATLKDLGQFDGAMASYGRALEIKPDYAEAHNNLGAALRELGQIDNAMASYYRALEIKPDYAEAYSSLGNALKEIGRLDAALASYARALELKPDYAEAYNNLGSAQKDCGQLDDAVASYQRALEIKPDYVGVYNNLLFVLNYHPDTSGEEVFAVYREYDQRFGLPHREKWRPHGNSRDANRRLKVGYVSPDFRLHSCRHFLEPLLAHHDKNLVEVYAYAELAREDAVTARYRGYADHWVATRGMSDDALSERIRSDGIDILVDLAGHTDKNRLSVFARKPAPVSLSWLGFGYTTGLTAIDYLLTDTASAPPGSEGLFSETPWRLETPGYAYRPAEGMGEVSSLPALKRGHITFGTLTRAVRLNHRVIRAWSEILKRVEGARLVIDSSNFRDAAMQDALAAKFAAHGVARDRLEIGCHSPPWEVLRGLDIGLDCFPHNSGTTLFETLYMGVPFVTLAGRPSVGRLGSSILEGVGHPWLIARSEDEYIEKAVALASDLPKLAALRGGLRHEMESGPLMDEARFARKVEAAYREMWLKWNRNGQHGGNGEESSDRTPQRQTKSQGISLPESLPQTERSQLVALFNAGRYAELESQACLLVERYPDSGFAWKGLGASLQMQGKNALAALQKATELLPDDGDAHINLGNALRDIGRLDDAVVSYCRALAIEPDFADAHYNLGNVLQDLGQLKGAVASYGRALEIKPDFAEAHSNLGVALKDCGQVDDAVASYGRALEIKPDFADAYNNLGNALKELGQLDGAVASYTQALESKPNYVKAFSNLLFIHNYLADQPAAILLADARSFGDLVARQARPHTIWRNVPEPGRCLRVGLVSGDLHNHPVGYFVESVLAALASNDSGRLELIAYPSHFRADALTERIKACCHGWHSAVGLSDENLARRIRDDGIDILIDLSGHTAHNRLPMFAWKPAPVQASWLGYFATTGVAAMDYFIADPWAAPETEEASFTEKIWRLPETYLCFTPPDVGGQVAPLPALTDGHITFGCFNHLTKMNDAVVALWARVLLAVPGSCLLLKTKQLGEATVRQSVVERFSAHGIDAERLILEGATPRSELLAAYRRVDIALDPFPYPGGTTSVEALWMGVPVVTLQGGRFLSLSAESILQNAGLPEWIAADADDYVARAVSHTGDLQRLAALRNGLRQQVLASPLFDAPRFARHFEAALRGMWVQWCNQQQGQPL